MPILAVRRNSLELGFPVKGTELPQLRHACVKNHSNATNAFGEYLWREAKRFHLTNVSRTNTLASFEVTRGQLPDSLLILIAEEE